MAAVVWAQVLDGTNTVNPVGTMVVPRSFLGNPIVAIIVIVVIIIIIIIITMVSSTIGSVNDLRTATTIARRRGHGRRVAVPVVAPAAPAAPAAAAAAAVALAAAATAATAVCGGMAGSMARGAGACVDTDSEQRQRHAVRAPSPA